MTKTNICIELYAWHSMENNEFENYSYELIMKEKHPGILHKKLEHVARTIIHDLYVQKIDSNIYVQLTDGCASLESPGSYSFKRYTKKPEQNDKWELERLLNNKKIINDVKELVDLHKWL